MNATNQEISRKLRAHAAELARHGDNLYRVRAFRQAAMAILALPQDLTVLLRTEGVQVLERLPGVGKSLSATISGYLQSLDSTSLAAT